MGEAVEDRVGVERDLLVGCCLEDLFSLCDLLLESYYKVNKQGLFFFNSFFNDEKLKI